VTRAQHVTHDREKEREREREREKESERSGWLTTPTDSIPY